MPIAAPTGKCEIGSIGLSAVLDRDDVIHLVREEGDICGKETVLTSLARSVTCRRRLVEIVRSVTTGS